MQLSFLIEIKKHKIRALKTLFTCMSYICMGLQSSVIGVALLDLQTLTGSNFDTITLIVTGRALGYGTGSVVGGFLDERFNTQFMMMVSLFIGSAVHFGIPLCRSLIPMIMLNLIAGISCGIADNRKYNRIYHMR